MNKNEQELKEQHKKIGRATFIIHRKFSGNKTLRQILERLILREEWLDFSRQESYHVSGL